MPVTCLVWVFIAFIARIALTVIASYGCTAYAEIENKNDIKISSSTDIEIANKFCMTKLSKNISVNMQ